MWEREISLQMTERELVLELFKTSASEMGGATLWSKISCEILYEVHLMSTALWNICSAI